MKYLVYGAIALLSALILIQCAPEGDVETLEGSGDFAQSIQPIFGGSPPDAPEHAAVVGLHQLADGGTQVYVYPFCSGTLITEDVVITAAHCLNVGKRKKVRTMAPGNLAIYVGDDPAADILDHLYTVTETVIYPSYNPIALLNDIALVRLSRPVTEALDPVPNLPAGLGFTPADIGTMLNIAGFGDTEFGTFGVKLQVDVPLAGLGCDVSGCPDPGDAATQISYAQSDGGPCFGDSGGPAFAYRGGVAYVGGLTSYGDSYCTYYGVSTRVDAFQEWIDAFANPTPPPDCSADGYCNPDCEPGADPDCDVPPPPDCSADGYCNPDCEPGADPDCDVPPGDCGNGICDDGESCDGRYNTISCPGNYPGKTVGTPKKQFCYVGDTCEGAACP